MRTDLPLLALNESNEQPRLCSVDDHCSARFGLAAVSLTDERASAGQHRFGTVQPLAKRPRPARNVGSRQSSLR